MAKIKNLTGQRFGRLVVCRRAPSEKGARNGVYWECQENRQTDASHQQKKT